MLIIEETKRKGHKQQYPVMYLEAAQKNLAVLEMI